MARGVAVRHQPRRKPDLYTDPIRNEKPAARCRGHLDRLGHDNLDELSRLEALPLGESGTDPIFRMGVAGDCAATVDHDDELEEALIPAGSATYMRNQPICLPQLGRHPSAN